MNIIRYHHAHYNGNNADQAIKGNEIPLGARIVAVADAFDAMTSDRPYRESLTCEQAAAELRKCSGSQFDPVIVNAFFRSGAQDSKTPLTENTCAAPLKQAE
jgi:HD-GYP domain-containing protein (c-di-GMP phosphodiesterase class II)